MVVNEFADPFSKQGQGSVTCNNEANPLWNACQASLLILDGLPMTRPLVEVCVASVDECIIAEQAGANRLELNCALQLGGLTPSAALVQRVLNECQLPVVSMVRPRPGGFCYDRDDWKTLQQDAENLVHSGIHGIAFGCLNADRTLDIKRVEQVRNQLPSAELVFHRAFDSVKHWRQTIDQLADLGIQRIMTSGFASSVPEGLNQIAEIVEYAGDRIEVLPAGGINETNITQVIAVTGCNQVHGTFSERVEDPGYLDSPIRFAPNDSIRRTDAKRLKRAIAQLNE